MLKHVQSIFRDQEYVNQETGEIIKHKPYTKLHEAIDKATIVRLGKSRTIEEVIQCRHITVAGVVTSVAGGAAATTIAKGVITGVCLFTAGFIITDMVFPYDKLYSITLNKQKS